MPEPSLRVRAYVDADWNEWLRLSLALFPDTGPDDHTEDMRLFRNRSDAEVFVIEREGELGTLAGYVEVGARSIVDGCSTSPVGYIEAWYVDEDIRRTGFGRTLLRAAEDWSRARGYTEMGSDALLENDVSHAAHRNCGYEEVDRVINYRKSL